MLARLGCGGEGSGGLVELFGALLVVAIWLLEWCLVQNNDSKRKTANSKNRSPNGSHIFPLYNGFGLTTHGLTDISHLRTFMV